MPDTATTTAQTAPTRPTGTVAGPTAPSADAPLVDDETIVEEISIDGMCGVY